MTDIKRITVPVEFTIKEGVIFLMSDGGSWREDDGGASHGFGTAGAMFAVYLPDGKAITLNVMDVIKIGLDAIKEVTA